MRQQQHQHTLTLCSYFAPLRESAKDAIGLQELGVTHVLNSCSQLPNFHPNKFVYLKIDMLDDPSTPIVQVA